MIAAALVNWAAAERELRIAAVARVAWAEVPEAAAAPFKASIVAAVPRAARASGAAPAEEALAAAGLPGAAAVEEAGVAEDGGASRAVSGLVQKVARVEWLVTAKEYFLVPWHS